VLLCLRANIVRTMDDLIASEEEDYCDSTKRSFKRFSDVFEK